MIKDKVWIKEELADMTPLNPQQRNWLFMILKALYDSRFDGSFTDNDMQTVHTIMHDLNLYYDSTDEESK